MLSAYCCHGNVVSIKNVTALEIMGSGHAIGIWTMQWWTIGDDTVIGYYRDNLHHCVIQSQIIIVLFKDGHII